MAREGRARWITQILYEHRPRRSKNSGEILAADLRTRHYANTIWPNADFFSAVVSDSVHFSKRRPHNQPFALKPSDGPLEKPPSRKPRPFDALA